MSPMEISKSIPQNLDYSERNQILPKNDTQKSGNSQKMIPKNPGITQKVPKDPGATPRKVPKIMKHPHITTYASYPPGVAIHDDIGNRSIELAFLKGGIELFAAHTLLSEANSILSGKLLLSVLHIPKRTLYLLHINNLKGKTCARIRTTIFAYHPKTEALHLTNCSV